MSFYPQLFGKRVLNASRKHAEKVFPKESIGLIIDGKFIAVENVHPTPEKNFRVSPTDLIRFHGKIQAVIHSHNVSKVGGVEVHSWGPSKADMACQIAWNVPFGIQYVTEGGAGNIVWWGPGVPVRPYEGRPYVFGVMDCYSIVRDWYEKERGVILDDFARADYYWEEDNAVDLYIENVKSQGFTEVEDRKFEIGDVIMLKIRSKIVNHSMIYLGGDVGLHHLSRSLSRQESISRFIDPDKALFHSAWRYSQ